MISRAVFDFFRNKKLPSNAIKILFISTLLSILPTKNSTAEEITTSHGISIFGDLKYPKDFKHFEYVNANAPKGGTAKLGVTGTFDSLNPFILKGVSDSNIDLTYDKLMESAADESASEYGLLAASVEMPKSKEWIIFNLRPEAKWNDGTKITADDVIFSLNILREKGHPQYKTLYRDVKSVEKLSPTRVKFSFSSTENRELPLIVGQLPILPKAYYEKNEFDKTTLTPPLSSGPYIIKKIEPGRSITYERNKNYWAKNLPVNIGRYNFDIVNIDYYLDETVTIEALKAGEYDFRRENISKSWIKNYNIPQVEDGRMVKENLPDGTPTGMQCFAFNIRRPNFQNAKIREALAYAYDFEWANKQLFYGAYTRNTSYFGNSEFASSSLPSKAELTLLEPYRNQLPSEVFTKEYQPPVTTGDGDSRANLLKAQQLIKESGWPLRDMKLINPETNKPVEIEFLLVSPTFERIVAPFIKNLKKLGIESTIRTVDSSQYIKRQQNFDFDVIVNWFTQGPSPGNEQINYWTSAKADEIGSQNIIGIKNPAVDFLVEKIVSAKDKAGLKAATSALDRVLLWNFYAIPQWYSRSHRVIYWNKFGRPQITPPYALGFVDTWWVK